MAEPTMVAVAWMTVALMCSLSSGTTKRFTLNNDQVGIICSKLAHCLLQTTQPPPVHTPTLSLALGHILY